MSKTGPAADNPSLSDAESEPNARKGARSDTLSVSVIIPAHNEEAAIATEVEKTISAMRDSGYESYEVIVVDDGSTDGTAELARATGARVITHPRNLGQGAALRTGITQARGSFVAFLDADGTYPAQDIPRLISVLEKGDYEQVIGDRTSEEGTLRWLRRPVKGLVRRFASFLTGRHVGDLNSGMRALTKEAAMRYLPLIPDGFSNSTTLTLASLSHRGHIAFIPIEYRRRREGRSKFRPIEDTYNMVLTIVRMVMYVDPLRVLFPVAVLLVLGGAVKGVIDLYRFDLHVATSSVLLVLTGIQIAAVALIADLLVRRTK